LQTNAPRAIVHDDRPGSPAGNILWAGNQDEVGVFLYGYRSGFAAGIRSTADAGERTVRCEPTSPDHAALQQGTGRAPESVRAEIGDTAINPAVAHAFALAIVADGQGPAFPDVPGHTPDLTAGRRSAEAINQAMDALLEAAPGAGSYLNEADFFDENWRSPSGAPTTTACCRSEPV
jgi:hypothetical protein